MTTANKVPANWAEGLKMADAIAIIVKVALSLGQADVRVLRRLGALVGLSAADMDEAEEGK
jgi:hypothetical protein